MFDFLPMGTYFSLQDSGYTYRKRLTHPFLAVYFAYFLATWIVVAISLTVFLFNYSIFLSFLLWASLQFINHGFWWRYRIFLTSVHFFSLGCTIEGNISHPLIHSIHMLYNSNSRPITSTRRRLLLRYLDCWHKYSFSYMSITSTICFYWDLNKN